MNSRTQSATTTPKRQQNSNSGQEKNRKSSTLNIFGDTSSGRKSPSNASIVSVPIRRSGSSGTPQDQYEKVPSERSNNKDQR
jgi:hypothetical protein